MTRPHHAEVPPVQGRQLRLIEALNDCKDGSIDKADIGVCVLPHDLCDTDVVLIFEVLYGKGSICDVLNKIHIGLPSNEGLGKVIHLNEHRAWNHSIIARPMQQRDALRVGSVVLV